MIARLDANIAKSRAINVGLFFRLLLNSFMMKQTSLLQRAETKT